ncbi:MAG: apolipoprotein N-acyltransferase [Comamonadaceae bacterium]|jgi:apolipoprotein N-acyltransferase|nr:apolipoprotein N-acyltransferase [Comamonadaceae bacterium]
MRLSDLLRPAAWRAGALLMLAGLCHALSLAWPFEWGWYPGQPMAALQVAAAATLVAVLERCQSGRQALAAAWLFATCMLAGTFWWLFISMHTYGGLAAPLAVLAVAVLSAALGLYYALAGVLYWRWRQDSVGARVLLWASLWLLAELARVALFTGFPWGQSGYAHVDGWAQPLAGWIGVHGLSWLSAAVAAALALWLVPARQRPRPKFAMALVIGALTVGWLEPIEQTHAPRPPLAVSLVQGNIAQDEKFVPSTGLADALRFYGQELQRSGSDLIVLPETAIAVLPQQLDPAYWQGLQEHFAQGTKAALLGMPLGSFEAGYTNSVIGLKPGAHREPYRYDKHHLVPFGEFIPPLFKWFVRMMNIPLGDFNRGAVGQPSFEWRGERLAPNICYEDLFGEELGARFADAQTAPTIMVNVSNIAWFGDTVAIDQHLQISRMRALELGRPMIRATNTGASVVIDAQGRVTDALPRHTRATLMATVQGTEGLTLYARAVAHFGLWPWLLWAGLGLLAVAALHRKDRSKSETHA